MDDFEAWYEQERPRVLAVCIALTGVPDEASEATDEAFVRALERWPMVGGMVSPGGWVQVVALNHLRRHLRRRSRERRLLQASRGAPGVAGNQVPDSDLWAAVAGLPRRQRTAVVLRYVHDLPETAIAEVMGIARGTVASTLAAATRALQQRLVQSHSDDSGPPKRETLK